MSPLSGRTPSGPSDRRTRATPGRAPARRSATGTSAATPARAIRFVDGHPDDLRKAYEERRKFIIEDGGFPYEAAAGMIGALLRKRGLNTGLLHKLLHAFGRLVLAGYNALRWISRRPFL